MSKRVDLEPVRHWAEKLFDAKDKIARYKQIESEARDMILDAMGDAEEGMLDGRVVLTHEKSYQRRISIEDLRARFPEIAAQVEADTEIESLRKFKDTK
jgi:hypothetical protein